MTILPDQYLGKQFSDVQNQLIGLGMQVDPVEVFDDSAAGTVLKISPTGVVKKGDAIKVTYSKGPEKVSVPGFAGKTAQQFNNDLTAAGLVPAMTSQASATVPAGQVISANPAPNTQVDKGSTVNYIVSTGQPSQPANPTPSKSP